MASPQSPEHVALGHVLRELRVDRGISQEELAFRAGLHRNYVGACERGEINLSFRVMLRLAAGLGVSFFKIAQRYDEIEALKGIASPNAEPHGARHAADEPRPALGDSLDHPGT
jgi:transcriptional regulator with XRE-family HTH domain